MCRHKPAKGDWLGRIELEPHDPTKVLFLQVRLLNSKMIDAMD